MSKSVSHTLDVYGDTLHLATTKAQARRLARKYEVDPKGITNAIGSTTTVQHSRTVENHILIWLNLAAINERPKPDRELIDTIAHEAAHAADYIAERGLNDEARAYLVGWIAGWLWENHLG